MLPLGTDLEVGHDQRLNPVKCTTDKGATRSKASPITTVSLPWLGGRQSPVRPRDALHADASLLRDGTPRLYLAHAPPLHGILHHLAKLAAARSSSGQRLAVYQPKEAADCGNYCGKVVRRLSRPFHQPRIGKFSWLSLARRQPASAATFLFNKFNEPIQQRG
jgi:hypothetical protein